VRPVYQPCPCDHPRSLFGLEPVGLQIRLRDPYFRRFLAHGTTMSRRNVENLSWRNRPVQFAGIRTNLELEIVGEPVMFFGQPPRDSLPQPEACLITGITPQ